MVGRSLKKACARATIAATGAAMVVMASLAFYRLNWWTLPGAAFMALMTMIIGFPIAGMGVLLIGVPMHLGLRRLGWVSVGAYVSITTIPACLGWAAYLGNRDICCLGRYPPDKLMEGIVVAMSVAGPVAALVFRRSLRPDREPDLNKEN